MNGKKLADEVTSRWPGTSVLFMSGFSQDNIVHDGRLDPGAKLLTKPFRKGDLATGRAQGPRRTRPIEPGHAKLPGAIDALFRVAVGVAGGVACPVGAAFGPLRVAAAACRSIWKSPD